MNPFPVRRLSLLHACLFLPAAGLLLLTGCVVEERPHPPREVVVVAPQPPPQQIVVETVPPPQDEVVVVEADAPPPAGEIIVEAPPPPPRQEVILVRPSPRHVWIAGYWYNNGRRYGWVAGHWVLPPREGAAWIAPHYEQRSNRQVFVAGFWRNGAGRPVASARVAPPPVIAPQPPSREPAGNNVRPVPSGVIVVRERVPPPQAETRPPAPSRDHVWIKGYWRHDGRVFVWVRGHWEKPPRRGMIWVEPRWEAREGGQVFIEGSWTDHRR